VLLLALGALGLPRGVLPALGGAVAGAYGLLAFVAFERPLYVVLGLALAAAIGALTWRMIRHEPFLAGWLAIELGVFFLTAPFPAVRRIMGIAVVTALIAACAAARRSAAGPSVGWRTAVGVGSALGLLFALVDQHEAVAQRDAVPQALARIGARDPATTVWFVGHWGFQHYAEQAGLRPVVPDVSRLRRGDWLLVPDAVHRQDVTPAVGDLVPAGVVHAPRALPWTTGLGYYGGAVPLSHLARPRLSTKLYRVRRDTVLPTAWPPALLAEWARLAGGRTAAAALPALVRALEDSSEVGRRQAAEGLGWLGPHGAPAVPALERALDDPDPAVRAAAASALAAIVPD
jgi:hypothetical protein